MAALREASRAVDDSSPDCVASVAYYAVQTARIVAILAGSYFIVAGLDILFARFLNWLGVSQSEAVTWSVMLGFLLYVGIVMWAFAAPVKHRPASVIVFLALVMTCVGIMLTPGVIS